MLELMHQERDRREASERDERIRAWELQSGSVQKMMDTHIALTKSQEKSKGHERISAAFATHSNPSEQQRSMFSLLVRAIEPSVVLDSPATKSARASAEINLPRRLPLQFGPEVDVVAAASSSSSLLALQNGV
jgi:hypothetical protein